MTGPVSTTLASRSASRPRRRWLIILPLLLGVVGSVAGLAAGSASKASAEALLLVQSDAFDGTGQQLAAGSAALRLNTREIFDAAAESIGADPLDLQARSDITTKPNSQIISITVSAPTAEQAVADANAVADAGVAAGPSRMPEALSRLTESTRELIDSQDLGNSDAERSRVARLGEELGASQAALVTDANQIQLLQSAYLSSRLPGGPILGLLGALCGALLGLALALLLKVGRGTVKSARDLADLYPHAAVVTSSGLQQALEMEAGARTVIVAGTRGEDLSSTTEMVREMLRDTTGKGVVIADSLASVPVSDSPNGHINLVTTTLSDTVLRRISRDEGAVLIVPVQARVTKLESVEGFASRLPDRSYLLVDEKAPEWD